MAELCRHRPVFHSEADLQHSFAKALWELAPDVRSRLEVPQRGLGKTEYLDLQCLGPGGRTAIEFKYFTRGWTGEAGTPVEDFILKAHGATDLARLHFVRDIARLERFCRRPDQNGLALMPTNEASLWTQRGRGRRRTRDHDFRIHHGRELAGTLRWAEGTYEPNTCSLRGVYLSNGRRTPSRAEQVGSSATWRCSSIHRPAEPTTPQASSRFDHFAQDSSRPRKTGTTRSRARPSSARAHSSSLRTSRRSFQRR